MTPHCWLGSNVPCLGIDLTKSAELHGGLTIVFTLGDDDSRNKFVSMDANNSRVSMCTVGLGELTERCLEVAEVLLSWAEERLQERVKRVTTWRTRLFIGN